MADDDELLSLAQAAAELQVSTLTLRRWIAKGTLRAHKPGRGLRIRRSDLTAMLEQSRTEVKRDVWERPGTELPESGAPSSAPPRLWTGEDSKSKLVRRRSS